MLIQDVESDVSDMSDEPFSIKSGKPIVRDWYKVECRKIGTELEGWYEVKPRGIDSPEEVIGVIKLEKCKGCEAICDYLGTITIGTITSGKPFLAGRYSSCTHEVLAYSYDCKVDPRICEQKCKDLGYKSGICRKRAKFVGNEFITDGTPPAQRGCKDGELSAGLTKAPENPRTVFLQSQLGCSNNIAKETCCCQGYVGPITPPTIIPACSCISSLIKVLKPGDNNIDFQTSHPYCNNMDCYSNVYVCPVGYNARVYVRYEMEKGYDNFYIYDADSSEYMTWTGWINRFKWIEKPNTRSVKFGFKSDLTNPRLFKDFGVDVDKINCYVSAFQTPASTPTAEIKERGGFRRLIKKFFQPFLLKTIF